MHTETRSKNVHGLRGPCPHASIGVVSTTQSPTMRMPRSLKAKQILELSEQITILCEIIMSIFSSGTEFLLVSKL